MAIWKLETADTSLRLLLNLFNVIMELRADEPTLLAILQQGGEKRRSVQKKPCVEYLMLLVFVSNVNLPAELLFYNSAKSFQLYFK